MRKLESVEALQRLAAARFSKYQRELFKARDEEWQRLTVDHPIFMHWVHHAFRVIEERLIQDAEERIRIYKEVSRDYDRPDLLRREHLQRLRDDITGGMNLLCQVHEDEIQKVATARYFTGPLPGVAQYNVLRGHVLDVVIACLDELEAECVAADDRAESLATPAAGARPAGFCHFFGARTVPRRTIEPSMRDGVHASLPTTPTGPGERIE